MPSRLLPQPPLADPLFPHAITVDGGPACNREKRRRGESEEETKEEERRGEERRGEERRGEERSGAASR